MDPNNIGDILAEVKAIPYTYNYHILDGIYKELNDQEAINTSSFEDNIKDSIKKYLLASRPTYAFNPDFKCKVDGSFKFDQENITNLKASVEFDSDENIEPPVKIDNLTDNDGGPYSFKINLFVDANFGILKYDNLSITLEGQTKSDFQQVNTSILEKNNKDRNEHEELEFYKNQTLYNARIATEEAKKKQLEEDAQKLAEEIKKMLDDEEQQHDLAEKQEALRNESMDKASTKLLEVLDSAIKDKIGNQGGKADSVIHEESEDNIQYIPGPDSVSTQYINRLSYKQNPITKDEYNKLENRYTFLKNKTNRSDKENSEIDSIVQLNVKVRNKNNGSSLNVPPLKNGPVYQDFAIITGGSRRTLKRGGKKTRRQSKRSQRRRSGRRGKRTSRR